MEQDLFASLPREMTMNILSRLPVATTLGCKCVCKSWLHLLETPEFVKYRFPKSIPGLAVFRGNESSTLYELYEFVDELDPTEYFNSAFKFRFPHSELIHSSADGLLLLGLHPLLSEDYWSPNHLIICNPVTRDYIKLPDPPLLVPLSKRQSHVSTYGFGVSKMSGQYKVVRIFNNLVLDEERTRWEGKYQVECQVYTLGTGSWRSFTPSGPINFEPIPPFVGAFMNGNFHLLVKGSDAFPSLRIACFDLETELLSTFSHPPLCDDSYNYASISALRDCLCVFEISTVDEAVIWLMNSYGDETSWTKQFIISRACSGDYIPAFRLRPIKVFKDGDILFACVDMTSSHLYFYSSKTKTMGDTGLLTDRDCMRRSRTSVVTYTPSFLSLKTFTMEKVSSFRFEQMKWMTSE